MDMTTCPNCKMRVFPKSNGTCPSCQASLVENEKGSTARPVAPGEKGEVGQKIEQEPTSMTPPKEMGRWVKVLIALSALFILLVVSRLIYAQAAAKKAEVILNQNVTEWTEMSEEELPADMVKQIGAVDATPLGYDNDGLFNEPFDDVVAFDAQGLTTFDAHDSIDAVTDAVITLNNGYFAERDLRSMLQYSGEATLRSMGVDTSAFATDAEMAEMKTALINKAALLVSLKYKAHTAQVLGLLDILSGVLLIGILVTAGIYAISHRGAKGNQKEPKNSPK